MEVLFARCSGLDVHKRSVEACVRIQHDDGRIEVQSQTIWDDDQRIAGRWRTG